ncbi:hypothetical protein I4F81_009199 [Pyropia yezoensis]|uniref:Uncharacterized protein n=1 Tax=Pyropia yezoensis TaxID=2788 RepID=A0ACC3C9X3_PYRYE|nr:hypothetical protein I4F81_009199 [Neopyropia yezoensis]|eukprot:contig_20830_g5104
MGAGAAAVAVVTAVFAWGAGTVAATTDRNGSACATALATCLNEFSSGTTCTPSLPVPIRELSRTLPESGYNLTLLRPGVFSYLDGVYTSLLVWEPKGRQLVVVDAADSPASNTDGGAGTLLNAAVDEVLDGATPRKVHILYSHAHLDHIGASHRVVEHLRAAHPAVRVAIWGTDEADEMVQRSSTRRALRVTRRVPRSGARLSLTRGLRVDLHVVGGHTATDLAIHIPPTKRAGGAPGVLHHADVVFPGWSPPYTLAFTEDVGRFRDVHTQLLELDWEVFSGGHLTRLGTRADVAASRRYATDLFEAAALAIATVDNKAFLEAGGGAVADPQSPLFGNTWANWDLLRQLQQDVCAQAMVAKWGCVLAGMDVMIRPNCFAAIIHLLVEG